MRAITLSLTAFGPYLEKQVVNFEELGDESIFLITGPTGAGKTTIFDAICYALYGKASGSDRDQDSLRSHFATNDEPTEVAFRFALNNKVYEIIRNPKQQKKKERGDGYTDEPAKAILYEIVEGEKQLVSSRIKDVNESIEDRLGFDYEQFRKMVLIPQGEFRKLISENSREREAVLQKIFRTHFYEKITEELKVQSKELESVIKQLEADLRYEFSKVDWQHVDYDEEATHETILEKLKLEIEQTNKLTDEQKNVKAEQLKKIKAVEEKLHKARVIEEKFKEQATLTSELDKLEQDKESIVQKKEKLNRAQVAQQIIPLEEQSIARKQEWDKQQQRLSAQQEKSKGLENEYNNIKLRYQEAVNKEQDREQLKEKIKQEKAQLEKVNHYISLKRRAEELQKKKENEHNERKKIENRLAEIEKHLNEIDSLLSEENALTKTYYETKDKRTKQVDLNDKLSLLSNEKARLIKMRQEYSVIHRTYQDKQNDLKQLRTTYDTLEVKQKEQFATLLAHKLEAGEACPVCGSTEHPNKATHTKVDEDFKEMEQLKKVIQKKEAELESYQQVYLDHTTKGQSKRNEVEKLQEELKAIVPEFKEDTSSELQAEVQNQINSLNQVLKEVNESLKKIDTIKKEKETLKSQATEFKQTFERMTNTIQKTQDEFVRLSTQIEEMTKQLPKELKDPKDFALVLEEKETKYHQLISVWEQLKASYEKSHETLQKEHTVLEQLQEFEVETKKKYEIQQERFLEGIRSNGFKGLEDFEQSKLPLDVQKHVENAIQEYENQTKQIRFRLEELKEQLVQMERVNLKELEEQVDAYQEELQKINDTLFALSAKIKHDDTIKTEVSSILERKKELESDYYIVGNLADLSNGNNSLRLSFERYVLASFLDEILLQANVRLDRMTEHRYQLIRSGEVAKRGAQSGLDLEVMDHHTGITRSVKTLSGGEGFKAALSLALGLADVVQAHAGGVQMDTLFIDEGFGTLDELSLQQAIDCLKDLQESNRLLGIISHVPQLKNEIHTKLMITPSHMGSNLEFTFGK